VPPITALATFPAAFFARSKQTLSNLVTSGEEGHKSESFHVVSQRVTVASCCHGDKLVVRKKLTESLICSMIATVQRQTLRLADGIALHDIFTTRTACTVPSS